MKTQEYPEQFYAERHAMTLPSATTILSLALSVLPPVHSAVDYGCGVGTWLRVLQSMGVDRILGLEGLWADRRHLVISQEDFLPTDLSRDHCLLESYDLAISLEVAEHIEAEYARQFVGFLCSASKYVLFSAAIPWQKISGGHVNEQWPDYWTRLFAESGYRVVDCIRGAIWNDARIKRWYRQNVLLFVHEENLPRLNWERIDSLPDLRGLSLVHPDYYLDKAGGKQ